MILLDLANKAIADAITEQLDLESRVLEFKCSDFDGALFHVSSGHDNPDELNISLSYGGAVECLKQGGKTRLQKIYGSHLVAPEAGYDVTIKYGFNEIAGNREKLVQEISMLKAWLVAAPLLQAFDAAESGSQIPGTVDFPLRDSRERIWIQQDGSDRVTAVFSVHFEDADDIVFAKVFFAELKKSLQGAPSCDFNFNPPGELKAVKDLPRGSDIGYVTFVVFDRHFKGPKKDNCAFTLTTFRNYLHYHIKCSKSHLHTRMRARAENLLKILNRAKQESLDAEKKTATGRVFTRK